MTSSFCDFVIRWVFPVIASGTYEIHEGYMIDVDLAEHTMGLNGRYVGRFEIEGDTLRMVFNPVPSGARPPDLSKTGTSKRES